jgi:hypothetical protein
VSQRFLREKTALSLIVPVATAVCLAGCGASQPKQSGDENNFDATPTGSADATPTPKWSDKSSAKGDELTDENKKQMEDALRRGGNKAAQCASVVPDAARGEGDVKVTFDGKVGRIVETQVGPPWAGTPVESCIKHAFVGEYSLRFDGSLEVPYTVRLGPKAEPDKGKKK